VVGPVVVMCAAFVVAGVDGVDGESVMMTPDSVVSPSSTTINQQRMGEIASSLFKRVQNRTRIFLSFISLGPEGGNLPPPKSGEITGGKDGLHA